MIIDADFSCFPNDSPERDYFNSLLKLFQQNDVDTVNLEAGLAILHFLDRFDFVIGDVDSRSHPAAGSLELNAIFVSKVFGLKYEVFMWVEKYRAGNFEEQHFNYLSQWIEAAEKQAELFG